VHRAGIFLHAFRSTVRSSIESGHPEPDFHPRGSERDEILGRD